MRDAGRLDSRFPAFSSSPLLLFSPSPFLAVCRLIANRTLHTSPSNTVTSSPRIMQVAPQMRCDCQAKWGAV